MQAPFEALDVWQLSHALALQLFQVTKQFPREERFGLVSQLRRAALAIPSNIAEGNARGSPREYMQFCVVARGSLAEVRYLLRVSRDLGFLEGRVYERLVKDYDRVGKMLHYLMMSIKEGRAK
ncbi:MAG: hypothetical protein AUI83_08700 [Armatimonadetes bacterium 13_1_40CM_3_65_7]|nr:MAG: hypothetical protein AUI83_08700 [Armatimonadetes bacterium 13_1_40CM_3_65_7]